MANLLLPFFLLTKMPLIMERVATMKRITTNILTPTEREPALLCGLPVKFPVSACPLSGEISSIMASTSNRFGF
jgi:hypothetical protein